MYNNPPPYSYGPPPSYGAPRIRTAWIGIAWRYWRTASGTWIPVGLIALVFLIAVMVLSYWIGAKVMGVTVSRVLNEKTPIEIMGSYIALVIWGTTTETVDGLIMGLALIQLRGGQIRTADLFRFGNVLPSIIAVSAIETIISAAIMELLRAATLALPHFRGMHGVETVLSQLSNSTVGAFFLFARVAAIDRGIGPVDAISFSYGLIKNRISAAIGFSILGSVMELGGMLLCCVGMSVMLVVFLIAVPLGYLELTGQPLGPTQMPPPTWPPQPPSPGGGVWPPPPNSGPPPYYR